MARPEQSKVDGPAAAQTYGLPSFDFATAIAVAAPPLAGTFTGGADEAGGDDVGGVVVRESLRDARSVAAVDCEWRNVCRSEADSRSNIAWLCPACLDRAVRLAARS